MAPERLGHRLDSAATFGPWLMAQMGFDFGEDSPLVERPERLQIVDSPDGILDFVGHGGQVLYRANTLSESILATDSKERRRPGRHRREMNGTASTDSGLIGPAPSHPCPDEYKTSGPIGGVCPSD